MKTSTLARKVPVLTAGGAIAVAVALGGTAAADALPAPLQNVAHTVFGAPAPPRPAAPLPSRIRHSPQFGNGRTRAPSVAAAPSPSPLKTPQAKHTSTAKARQKAVKKATKARQKAAKKAAKATAKATKTAAKAAKKAAKTSGRPSRRTNARIAPFVPLCAGSMPPGAAFV